MHQTPLNVEHRALGAKMVPFADWEMPLSYPTGTLEEHRLCREDAVMFDVSHMGTIRVSGSGAHGALQRTFTNDLGKIGVGRAQYTHLLDPEDASVVDDVIIAWVDDDVFDVVANASNTASVLSTLESSGAQSVTDLTPSRAMIAVQGPAAREKLATVSPDAAGVGRFRIAPFTFDGAECLVAGTGYTGEDGVECSVPAEVASAFWQALLAAGVAPAGLGARDTLRLEAGLPLHGAELGAGITPLDAGFGWVVSWDKGDFIGRDALAAQRETGVDTVLRGLRIEGRRPPRHGQEVQRDGRVIGSISSGNFSPTLGHGIALAFVEPGLEPGDEVVIDVRGTEVPGACVTVPFLQR